MSLSKEERRELERLRRHYRQDITQETFKRALIRGGCLMILVSWIIPYFTSNRDIHTVVIIACIGLGILSSYYDPLKSNPEVERQLRGR